MNKRQQGHTRHKKDACSSNAQGGRRIAKTKDCTTRGDRDDEVEVGGKKREGRRKGEGRSRRMYPAGRGASSVSLVAVAVCERGRECVYLG